MSGLNRTLFLRLLSDDCWDDDDDDDKYDNKQCSDCNVLLLLVVVLSLADQININPRLHNRRSPNPQNQSKHHVLSL